jgi:ribonuclease HI
MTLLSRQQQSVIAYTDGACSGNPGPGGWAAIVIEQGEERELFGGERHTTNQRMELMGVIKTLGSLHGVRKVAIYSDSAYVINCFRDKWYERWRKNGWVNSQRKPVENRDLWELLIRLVEQHEVSWHKVAGHSGDPMNDRADALARAAILGKGPLT